MKNDINTGNATLMKIFRISLNSLIMVIANIGAIYCGFIVYYLFKPTNQMAVQLPVGVILSIAGFVFWNLLLQINLLKRVAIKERQELIYIYFAALIWATVFFVPLHYVTQGYLTSFGNIIAIWIFQLPVNLISIVAAYLISGGSPSPAT